MSDQLPEAPFTLQELEAIVQVLQGYSDYVQKRALSGTNAQRIQTIQRLKTRLAAQLVPGDVMRVQMVLTVEELEALLQVMLEFVEVLKRVFPQNEKRDGVIEAVTVWRSRLLHSIDSFGMK